MKDNEAPNITCPHCKQVSYNLGDIENKYCGLCGYHTENITDFFKQQGYERIAYVDGWGWCALNTFMFTWGVLYGMDNGGVKGRYCFYNKGCALLFLADLVKHGQAVELPVVGIDGCTAIK